MLKKIEIEGLCDYFADDERGCILTGKQEVKAEFYESGNKKAKVVLARKDSTQGKYFVCWLVLGAFTEFKDLKFYRVKFKDEDYTNTKLNNLEWERRENVSFYHFLNEVEYRLWINKLDSIPQQDWVKFNTKALQEFWNNEDILKDEKRRLQFFTKLFKIPAVKEVSDTSEINLLEE